MCCKSLIFVIRDLVSLAYDSAPHSSHITTPDTSTNEKQTRTRHFANHLPSRSLRILQISNDDILLINSTLFRNSRFCSIPRLHTPILSSLTLSFVDTLLHTTDWKIRSTCPVQATTISTDQVVVSQYEHGNESMMRGEHTRGLPS